MQSEGFGRSRQRQALSGLSRSDSAKDLPRKFFFFFGKKIRAFPRKTTQGLGRCWNDARKPVPSLFAIINGNHRRAPVNGHEPLSPGRPPVRHVFQLGGRIRSDECCNLSSSDAIGRTWWAVEKTCGARARRKVDIFHSGFGSHLVGQTFRPRLRPNAAKS